MNRCSTVGTINGRRSPQDEMTLEECGVDDGARLQFTTAGDAILLSFPASMTTNPLGRMSRGVGHRRLRACATWG